MKTTNFLVVLITAAVTLFYTGCGIEEPLERVQKSPKPYTKRLPEAYDKIQINKSTSADVLDVIKQYKQESISQSESVIASYGEKKKGYSFWLTMTAFNEEDFTVTRKHFLAVDEKPWYLGDIGQKLRFDTDMILDEETLTEAYTSENQKRIAILTKVLENIRNDIEQIRQESTIPATGGMMINQTFERILYVLSQSPVLAEKLDQAKGLEFDHLTLDKGQVGMKLEDKIVKVRILIGRSKNLWGKK
ncbi:MAG: hypothetical protein NTW93_10350 [Phycisphaerae bacterium]|nr:hypothetical protein [Phycisphaerae bacterium]